MDRIAKALYERDEVFAEINDVLFGGGADELISKLTDKEKFERRQAQIGLATNVVGIGAGAAATPPAFKAAKKAYDEHKSHQNWRKTQPTLPGLERQGAPGPIARKIALIPKHKKAIMVTSGGLAGLQVANLTGDFVANRVLNRAAKKKEVKKNLVAVAKSGPDQSEVHVPGGSLKVKAVKTAQPKAKKAAIKLHEQFVAKADDEGSEIVWEGEFSKVDDDKRQVFGYCSVVKIDGEEVVDKQGDHISIEEVEKSAYNYVQKSRKGGDMHRRNGEEPHHVSDMIESIVFTPEKIEKMGLPESTPLGWWVGFQVHDDATWQEVKKGNRKGFSIHGRGQRVEKVLT